MPVSLAYLFQTIMQTKLQTEMENNLSKRDNLAPIKKREYQTTTCFLSYKGDRSTLLIADHFQATVPEAQAIYVSEKSCTWYDFVGNKITDRHVYVFLVLSKITEDYFFSPPTFPDMQEPRRLNLGQSAIRRTLEDDPQHIIYRRDRQGIWSRRFPKRLTLN